MNSKRDPRREEPPQTSPMEDDALEVWDETCPHQSWRDIPPPRSIVRAKRDGHLVKIPKPVLVIDSAELRAGYTFERFSKWIAGIERRRLKDGDYTVQGLEQAVTIERKAAADAVNSVMPPQRAQFLERCARMAGYERKAIVIEASYAAMRSSYEGFTESRAHPNAVIGSYLAIQERWGIPVYFIDNRELAEEFVAHVLTKYYVRRWLQDANLGDHFQDGDI
jgi:ERCC4-type nuclease